MCQRSSCGQCARSFALVLLIYGLSAGIAVGALSWSRQTPHAGPLQGHRLIVLENDLITVEVIPEAGGRVIGYRDKATGTNHLYPGSPPKGSRGGGLWDREGVWPTTNLSDHPFSYTMAESADELEISLRADLGNLRVERSVSINDASYRVAVRNRYTNIGNVPIRTVIAQVMNLAVGGDAGESDMVIYPDGDGFVKRTIDSRRSLTTSSLSPSWWLIADPDKGESILVTFRPHRLIVERYSAVSSACTDLRLHARRHIAEPGTTLEMAYDLRLLKGNGIGRDPKEIPSFLPEKEWADLSEIIDRLTVGLLPLLPSLGHRFAVFSGGYVSLDVQPEVFRRMEPSRIRVITALQPDSEERRRDIRLSVDGREFHAFSVRSSREMKLDTRYVSIDTSGLSDGRHEIALECKGNDGEIYLKSDFAVVDGDRLAGRIEAAGRKLETLKRKLSDRSRMGSHLAACEMRLEDVRRKFVMGPDFAEWGNEAHALDVNKEPLNMHPGIQADDLDYIHRVLSEAEGRLDLIASGKDPFQDIRGLTQKAFRSRIDGSLQPYTVYVPDSYDGATPLPLILLLHGSGGDQWEITQAAGNFDGRSVFAGALEERPIESEFILCAPMARGASRYHYLAQYDILQTLEEVKRDYRIDEDRVYATGWSMGGAGSWHVAQEYPERFAAIMPIAGSTDLLDLPNSLHLPCWNYHGLGDSTVSPGLIPIIEDAYHRLGMEYHDGFKERPFVWGPAADHWVGYRMMGSMGEIESILGRYKRVTDPKKVVVAISTLRNNRRYWAGIDGFSRYTAPAKLTAEIAEGNTIRVTTQNVAGFSLYPNDKLVDMNRNVRVLWNGNEVYNAGQRTELSINGPNFLRKGLVKKQGLSGPLSDVYHDPFLLVRGASGKDIDTIEAVQREVQAALSTALMGVRYYDIPVKDDKEVTEEDIRKYHLILFGGPSSNSITARINDKLPIRIEGGSVVAGDKRFDGEDVGYRMIYPNPLNRDKYVVVCAAATAAGMEGLGSIPPYVPGWNPRVTEPDALITDSESRGRYRRYRATYVFDGNWKIPESGKAIGKLSTSLTISGYPECTWGYFRADVLREATGADIALVDATRGAAFQRGGDNAHPFQVDLGPGEVTLEELEKAGTWDPVYIIKATGVQIKDAIERSLIRLGEGRNIHPIAVSGFSYEYRMDKPPFRRAELHGIDPEKTYRVVATGYMVARAVDTDHGAGYLGWIPEIEWVKSSEIDAQADYFRRYGTVEVKIGGRVREL